MHIFVGCIVTSMSCCALSFSPRSIRPRGFLEGLANPEEGPRALPWVGFEQIQTQHRWDDLECLGSIFLRRLGAQGWGVVGVEVTAPQKPLLCPAHQVPGFALPLPGCSDIWALPWVPPLLQLVNKAFISWAGRGKFQAFIIKCPGEGQLPNSGAGCPSGGDGWSQHIIPAPARLWAMGVVIHRRAGRCSLYRSAGSLCSGWGGGWREAWAGRGGSPDLSWCRRGSRGARESWGEPPCLVSSASYRRPRLPHPSGRKSEAKHDSTLFLTSNPSAFLLLLPLDGSGCPLLLSVVVTILIWATSSVPCDVLPLLGGCHSPPLKERGNLLWSIEWDRSKTAHQL